MIWKVPAHDPRIESMTEMEFELEVVSYFEAQQLLSEAQTKGGKPSPAFLDKVKQLQAQADAGKPITPESLGWDKEDG